MITRKEALSLLKNYLQDDKLRKHSFAVEAIMQETATFLNKDTHLWRIVGLLHDIDYEYTQNNPNEHGTVSAELLKDLLPPKAINAIKGHNYIHTGYLPTTYLDKALIAADAVSGLIIATALVMPKKKMNDSSFAKNIDRKRIQLCQDLQLELDDFLTISLKALQNIHEELSL
jgi:putative nucleotidyltransferase with HDIG domain